MVKMVNFVWCLFYHDKKNWKKVNVGFLGAHCWQGRGQGRRKQARWQGAELLYERLPPGKHAQWEGGQGLQKTRRFNTDCAAVCWVHSKSPSSPWSWLKPTACIGLCEWDIWENLEGLSPSELMWSGAVLKVWTGATIHGLNSVEVRTRSHRWRWHYKSSVPPYLFQEICRTVKKNIGLPRGSRPSSLDLKA